MAKCMRNVCIKRVAYDHNVKHKQTGENEKVII